MKRFAVALLLVIGLAGCANKTIPLPEVDADDPVTQLNPDRWQATINDLITPPESKVSAQ